MTHRHSPLFVSGYSPAPRADTLHVQHRTLFESCLKTTADTVSVLQQAPGFIITRAPDEVQWACGGARLTLLLMFVRPWRVDARYFRYLTLEHSPGAGVARAAVACSYL